jgi:hypothetical protein
LAPVSSRASCGNGSSCGLGLIGRASTTRDAEAFPFLDPGESFYQDITIDPQRGLQIDLINESTATEPVDAYLTTATCDKLFAGTYTGGKPAALCTIYYGPVAHGVTGPRKKISPGNYRIFVQAYANNPAPAIFNIELGIWSDDCRKSIVGPGP